MLYLLYDQRRICKYGVHLQLFERRGDNSANTVQQHIHTRSAGKSTNTLTIMANHVIVLGEVNQSCRSSFSQNAASCTNNYVPHTCCRRSSQSRCRNAYTVANQAPPVMGTSAIPAAMVDVDGIRGLKLVSPVFTASICCLALRSTASVVPDANRVNFDTLSVILRLFSPFAEPPPLLLL